MELRHTHNSESFTMESIASDLSLLSPSPFGQVEVHNIERPSADPKLLFGTISQGLRIPDRQVCSD
jgi:hypothetical protein